VFPRAAAVSFKWQNGVTNAAMGALATRCNRLTSVEFVECVLLTDAGVAALARGCPGLAVVIFNRCKNLTDAAVVVLAAGCPGLTWIELRELNVTDAAVGALAGGLTTANFKNFIDLEDATAALHRRSSSNRNCATPDNRIRNVATDEV
jgi:hypothetical protein